MMELEFIFKPSASVGVDIILLDFDRLTLCALPDDSFKMARDEALLQRGCKFFEESPLGDHLKTVYAYDIRKGGIYKGDVAEILWLNCLQHELAEEHNASYSCHSPILPFKVYID